MKIYRIYALYLRHFYLIRSSFPRLLDLIYWPTIQIILWGFISKFFTMHSEFYNHATGIILSAAILYTLLNRSILELNVLHDRNPLFVKLSNGQIRNSYDIKILNKSFKSKKYSLSIEGLKNSKIKIQGIESLSSNNLPVVANSVGHYRIFLIADKNIEVRKKVIFNIKELNDEISDTVENIFISGKY